MGLGTYVAILVTMLCLAVFLFFGLIPWLVEGGARSIIDVFMEKLGYSSTPGTNWWAGIVEAIANWWADVTSNLPGVSGGFR